MEVIMAKYGEIALKGLNKSTFEDMLVRIIRRRLKDLGKFEITRLQSTVYIRPDGEIINDAAMDKAEERLTKIFGIAAVQRSIVLPKDFALILEEGLPYLEDALAGVKTFKVEAKRSDKSFPMKTPDLQRELGGAILEKYPHLTVDVHDPQVTVTIEIRDKAAYLSPRRLLGAGGMPVSSNGAALALLSGGIDSPAAVYMMAKRGLRIAAVHFQSPPYTSERALMKVEEICRKLTVYCGDIRLYIVPFTEIQEKLRDNCPQEYFTVIMRRLMIKIANRICRENNYKALVTGESVGQVASQTLHAICCTDKAAEYPVFRPVIGMDKKEIVELARKIDTFEISTLPYEDCCTVFSPKHPKTRPSVEDVEAAEAAYDFAPLIDKTIGNIIIKDFDFEG